MAESTDETRARELAERVLGDRDAVYLVKGAQLHHGAAFPHCCAINLGNVHVYTEETFAHPNDAWDEATLALEAIEHHGRMASGERKSASYILLKADLRDALHDRNEALEKFKEARDHALRLLRERDEARRLAEKAVAVLNAARPDSAISLPWEGGERG